MRLLAQPRVLLAGCFLGFCSDIRTLGPASGLLVAVYFLYKAGAKAIPYLLEYLGVGALTIYVFWPYLWSAPLNRFLSSLSEAADFPWKGNILFAGNSLHPGKPACQLSAGPVHFAVYRDSHGVDCGRAHPGSFLPGPESQPCAWICFCWGFGSSLR